MKKIHIRFQDRWNAGHFFPERGTLIRQHFGDFTKEPELKMKEILEK